MQFTAQFNKHGQGGSATQQQVGKALEAAGELAKAGADLLKGSPDPTTVAKRLLDVGRVVLDSSASIQKIDREVQKLDTAAPGTVKVIKELGNTIDAASKIVSKNGLPNGLKPIYGDLQTAAKEFKDFSGAYDDYVASSKLSGWNPRNWGAKATAAAKVQSEWNEFKTAWAKVESHVPAPLRDPKFKDAAREAGKEALDLLKKALE